MEALLAFAAALLAPDSPAFGPALACTRRGSVRRMGAALAAYAVASAALAWGTASGWTDASFRVYYLFGGLHRSAPRVGSLLLSGAGGRAQLASSTSGSRSGSRLFR